MFAFQLDEEGCRKCSDLLHAAGMEFLERSHETDETGTTIHADLVSPHGTFRCDLSSSRHPLLVVAIRGHTNEACSAMVAAVRRALGAHLMEKNEAL